MFGDFLMIFHAKKWLIIQLQQLEKMNHFTVSLVKLVSWLRISARSCNESNKLESPKPNPRTPKPTLSWMKPTLQGTRKHIPPKRESRKIIFQNCFGKGYVTSQEGKSFFLKKIYDVRNDKNLWAGLLALLLKEFHTWHTHLDIQEVRDKVSFGSYGSCQGIPLSGGGETLLRGSGYWM